MPASYSQRSSGVCPPRAMSDERKTMISTNRPPRGRDERAADGQRRHGDAA